MIDLVQWLHEEFAVSLDETTVGRELKKLGYVKLTEASRVFRRLLSVRRSCDEPDKEQVFT